MSTDTSKFTTLFIFKAIMIMTTTVLNAQSPGHYAEVNGIRMYYEIHGSGNPLVLLHGGGSTINTSFGRILPELAKTHRIIAVELQAHGHTGDRSAPETFKQDADDVAQLLRQLQISSADFLGFSNGGQTTLELAIHHAGIVRKIIVASAFYSRSAAPAAFWDGFAKATLKDMPQPYRDEYLSINHDSAKLLNMFNKDVQRMAHFTGWAEEEIRSIKAPAFIVSGDRDVATPEHTVKMWRLIPHARLAILPGAHGEYLGEVLFRGSASREPDYFIDLVNEFLKNDQ
jgi:pimeloyl-ACP methyl ester carboxylesterase